MRRTGESSGESHGQRSLVGYSPQGRKESDTTEWLHLFSRYILPLLQKKSTRLSLFISSFTHHTVTGPPSATLNQVSHGSQRGSINRNKGEGQAPALTKVSAAGRSKQATGFAVFWDNLRETVSCGKKKENKKEIWTLKRKEIWT